MRIAARRQTVQFGSAGPTPHAPPGGGDGRQIRYDLSPDLDVGRNMDGPKQVRFRNRDIDIAANLHVPADFGESCCYPAIVLATPGSSVKEQVGAICSDGLARRCFVALTFDPPHQGESDGERHDLEDPAARVEDIRCALDFLMRLPYVPEERVGVLGVCAGGGYAVAAALTEHRFKAVGTVVASDIGRAFRGLQSRDALFATLQELGRQRTADARGGAVRRDAWISDGIKEAEAAGVTDPRSAVRSAPRDATGPRPPLAAASAPRGHSAKGSPPGTSTSNATIVCAMYV